MDELVALRTFRRDAAAPPAQVAAHERERLLAVAARRPQRRRRMVVAAIAGACVLGAAGALAATGLIGRGVLSGPAAPAENDAALRALFPPLGIGHATLLAENHDRKLFGARTSRGGYCFSATSPSDPKGEGGHCVSDTTGRRLDAGKDAAFSVVSGSNVGGYAPGAEEVHLEGPGVDVAVPVGDNGWWLGVAELRAEKLMNELRGDAYVTATSIGSDGDVLARHRVIRIHAIPNVPHVVQVMPLD
jgi:hypothetical protein